MEAQNAPPKRNMYQSSLCGCSIVVRMMTSCQRSGNYLITVKPVLKRNHVDSMDRMAIRLMDWPVYLFGTE